MKSLFEKEENDLMIDQLKVDLISLFYPLSKQQILKYRTLWDFDDTLLFRNESIFWDNQLLDELEDEINWNEIWCARNLCVDIDFLNRYNEKIQFDQFYGYSNIFWSKELIKQYGEKLLKNKKITISKPYVNSENLKMLSDWLNWDNLSRFIDFKNNEELIDEFLDKWNWQKLSANVNLPLSVEFIQKYHDRLNFDELSLNPAAIELIFKYPKSKKWNWYKVIKNPGIIYDQNTFEFVYSYFKKTIESDEKRSLYFRRASYSSFIFHAAYRSYGELSFFYNHKDFEGCFTKIIFEIYLGKKLSLDLIEQFKTKLDFTESTFIQNHKDVMTSKFLESNLSLFEPKPFNFYRLPLNYKIIKQIENEIDWWKLSTCEKFDWTEDFIYKNLDKLNLRRLGDNKGVYNSLIVNKFSKDELIKFLDKELDKKKKWFER
ncbi:hypothetical protein [Aquirufa nivalisilvae]